MAASRDGKCGVGAAYGAKVGGQLTSCQVQSESVLVVKFVLDIVALTQHIASCYSM